VVRAKLAINLTAGLWLCVEVHVGMLVGQDRTGASRVESGTGGEGVQRPPMVVNGIGLHGVGAWILVVSLAAVWTICAGKWSLAQPSA
jgi:hypothetical protein